MRFELSELKSGTAVEAERNQIVKQTQKVMLVSLTGCARPVFIHSLGLRS